jgi:L-alanine-DL-glutamate epimerase-like enolase superfamily enzyme
MNKTTRREVLAAAVAPFVLTAAARGIEIAVAEIRHSFENYRFRTPLKFGGAVIDEATLLNVDCVVRTRAGRTAKGFGSMPLGNAWAYPSKTMAPAQTLAAMRALSESLTKVTGGFKDYGHPVDINVALEPEYLKAAAGISTERKLDAPIPKLATLVVASAFDAAIHDAYGKLHGRNCYLTYGREFMRHDLAHYLTPEFKGEYLDRYTLRAPKPSMPLYHLIGALDPIEDTDIRKRLNDGLPETLPEWIRSDGLTHLKIKLNGNDLTWDVERVVRVDRVASTVQASRGIAQWVYSLDFNEKCPNVAYLLDFLRQAKEKTRAGFDRIQYIEQPTARDLKTHRSNVMHEASKLRPVVIDESLTDLESMMLAREMGYTGAALKACKGQTQALLMAAAAQKFKMFLCVQDLTCPGASLIQSAGLAAHIPGVAAIEANARQYFPAANQAWEARFPGVFTIRGGVMNTAILNRPGLSAI